MSKQMYNDQELKTLCKVLEDKWKRAIPKHIALKTIKRVNNESKERKLFELSRKGK